ncbi:MAG TPA: sigma 54-interacting transcriptional regulator [Myxococcaceae bacterium]|nr:sigma 54-interacting transcriptional regulator [Myxococcaceae bacterium]
MAEPLASITTVNVGNRSGGADAPRIPALTIISHTAMSRAGERVVLSLGEEIAISRLSPELKRPGVATARPLEDPSISRKPFTLAPGRAGGVVIRTGEGGTSVVVSGQQVRGERELGPEVLAAGVPLVLSERVVLLLHLVEPDGGAEDSLGMVGESAGIRQVRQQLRNVVDLDVPVLVRGETGTGKEKVAQALHERGPRAKGPFVSVNLGALSRELAAAELFGARRGAFTGADRDREGYFRAAQGGTLFLDEVGEAPPEVQVMLLRVLETGELQPVGSPAPIKVDVRLVTATDADLEAKIQTGQFRAPLLHRLAGYEIQLPPLRERREDIGLLFTHFAREELEALGEAWRLSPDDPKAEPWLPAELALALLGFSWPGNIRQLRNVTRQLIIGNRGRPSLRADGRLARELGLIATTAAPGQTPAQRPVPTTPIAPLPTPTPRRKPADVSKEELVAAMRACEWDLQGAADRLGLPRSSVYLLIEKFPDLRTAGDLTPEEIARCHQECGGSLDEMVKRLEVSRRALRRRLKELGLDVSEP